MKKSLEKAFQFSSVDTLGPVDALYGMDYCNVGFIVNTKTNRITFYPEIEKVTVIDSGNVETVKRKVPLIGNPIEVGVPTPSVNPYENVRVSFKDIKGRQVTITGLKISG